MAWGKNDYGELGVGVQAEYEVNGVYSSVPVQTPTGKKIVLAASGRQHTCFLASDGSVTCTGANFYGELALDRGTEYVHTPVAVTSLPGPIASISCGDGYTCAVAKDSSQVYCWGLNWIGELGFTNNPNVVPNDDFFHNTPILVPGVSGARSVMACHASTYVILSDTTAIAFGSDKYGQLGRGESTREPVAPAAYGQGVANILEIRGGQFATCMLNVAGDVLCAGMNQYGQLGVGGDGGFDHFPVLTKMASITPTKAPARKPTARTPTKKPTKAPTSKPTTKYPTKYPVKAPTSKPAASG